MAGIGAILLQIQATRLGIVSGLDLARQIRLLLHDCKRHTLLIRWGVLYPIYGQPIPSLCSAVTLFDEYNNSPL